MAIITAAGLATAGAKLAQAGQWAWNNSDKIQGLVSGLGLFGGGSSAATSAREQYKYNLKLQKQAQQWNEYMYRNRYQMQVEDLQSAGINKLYGLGTAPSVTSSTNSIGAPDYVGEKNAKLQHTMNLMNFGADISAKKAQGKLLEAQAKTEEYNTQLKALEVYTQQLENLQRKKNLDWTDKKNKAELYESISRTKQNLKNIEVMDLNTAQIKRYEEWIKKNPVLGKLLERTDKTSVSAKIFKNLFLSGPTGLRHVINENL